MTSSDLPWWQERKAQSLARRAASITGAGDSFLIVTEGLVTEPVYFELLRNDLQLAGVRVQIQPGRDSDPRHVIQSAADTARAQSRRAKRGQLGAAEPATFDQVWAVIDTDVAVRTGQWAAVEVLAKKLKVKLAHSTPCFEFWLLLHLGYTTRADLLDGQSAKRAWREAAGASPDTAAEMSRIFPKWPEAVRHAEKVRDHHTAAGTQLPANPSTEVCALVRALDASAPAHMRRLK